MSHPSLPEDHVASLRAVGAGVLCAFFVGEVSGQLGDLDAAFAAFQKALSLDPELIPALNSLSRLLAVGPDHDRRNPSEAIRLAEKANHLTNNQDPYLLETFNRNHFSPGSRNYYLGFRLLREP